MSEIESGGHAAEAAGNAAGHAAAGAEHGGDVFAELFHHLQDEVVIPLPTIHVGGIAIDLSVTKLVVMLWIVVALNVVLFGLLARKSRSLLPQGRLHNLL